MYFTSSRCYDSKLHLSPCQGAEYDSTKDVPSPRSQFSPAKLHKFQTNSSPADHPNCSTPAVPDVQATALSWRIHQSRSTLVEDATGKKHPKVHKPTRKRQEQTVHHHHHQSATEQRPNSTASSNIEHRTSNIEHRTERTNEPKTNERTVNFNCELRTNCDERNEGMTVPGTDRQ